MTERRKEEASEKAEEWFKNVSYVSLNKNAHLFSSRGMCYPAWEGTHRRSIVVTVGFLSLTDSSFILCPNPNN